MTYYVGASTVLAVEISWRFRAHGAMNRCCGLGRNMAVRRRVRRASWRKAEGAMGLGGFEPVALATLAAAAHPSSEQGIAPRVRPRVRGSRRPDRRRPGRGVEGGRTPAGAGRNERRRSRPAPYPVLGDMSVDGIAGASVMKAPMPIWSAKREIASRVRQRISQAAQGTGSGGDDHEHGIAQHAVNALGAVRASSGAKPVCAMRQALT